MKKKEVKNDSIMETLLMLHAKEATINKQLNSRLHNSIQRLMSLKVAIKAREEELRG